MNYDVVIGLEVHSELKTKTKAFCSCKNSFGDAPNTNCCEVCMAMPGALPVLNKKVVEFGVKAGLAFNTKISNENVFERKNYFYPDLSKSYQISQLEKPLCKEGSVKITLDSGEEKEIRIHQIHMEEDAGKLIHDDYTGKSLVDFNRCGVPLIEIVSEPDMNSSEEAIKYLELIKETLKYIDVSDVKMQEGSLRCDVNVSLKPKGSSKLGTRTEMKNISSFKAVKRAIEYEIKRQEAILNAGGTIDQCTLKWDDNLGKNFLLRSKEQAQDYRYFPEPDLLPVYVSEEYIAKIKEGMPELPLEKRERYKKELSLPDYDIGVLTMYKSVSIYFDTLVSLGTKPKVASNWVMSHVLRLLKEELDPENAIIPIGAENLNLLIEMVEKKEISSSAGKTVFEDIWKTGEMCYNVVERLGLKQLNNEDDIKNIVLEVLEENPQSVADYKAGNKRASGFITGQVMKKSKGKANPQIVNKIILELLNK